MKVSIPVLLGLALASATVHAAEGVYTNTTQIAAKHATAKVTIAFPDVVKTPGAQPAAPGVPIPYPNVSRRQENGPVKVDDLEVRLRNRSYYRAEQRPSATQPPQSRWAGKEFFGPYRSDPKDDMRRVPLHLD